MTQPVQTTGKLDKPVFIRGGPPAARQGLRALAKPSRWEDHMELGRQYPAWPNARKPPPGYEVDPARGWMLISRVTRGGKKTTMTAITKDRYEIQMWLKRHRPLERWQFSIRTVKDTWAERELFMRFLGILTEEEDTLDRKETRSRWEARQLAIKEKKAKTALEARLKARAEQERATHKR